MLAIGVALSLFAIVLTVTGATNRFDNVVYDWLLRASPRPASRDIAIVAIDDRSIAALGPWPWPHRVHARMLRELSRGRPRAIIYDVLFLAPGQAAGDDDSLRAALADSGRVFAPLLFRAPGDDGRAYQLVPPVPQLTAAAGLGHADVRPDGDGVVRRIDLALDGERRWLHVAALAARGAPDADRRLAALPPFAPRPDSAPLRRTGALRIAFGGPPGARFPTYSFIDVLEGRAQLSLRPGDYVLVGATAASLSDQYSTPVVGDASVMPGVELQASVLDTLVHGLGAVDAPLAVRLALCLAAIWLLMLAYLRATPRQAVGAWAGMILGVIALSAVLLELGRVWAPPLAAIAALGLAQPLWTFARLDAASRYMFGELSRLSADPGIFTGISPPTRLGQDRIARQIELMTDTVARVRDLRSLVATAVQSLPDPTVLVDLGGEVIMANAAAMTLFAGGGAVTNEGVERFFTTPGSPAPRLNRANLSGHHQPWNAERTGIDGSIRDVRCVAWLDGQGGPIGWILRFGDVTAIRLAERRREETLQLLTHDMRSPQASILALMAQNAASLDRHLRERVSHYAERTIALADGFLHLARADAGGFQLSPVNLADVVIEAVDNLWPLSSARGMRVETLGVDEEVLVNGEKSLLIRSLINLIGNAVKFSPDGSRIECGLRLAGGDDGQTAALFWVKDEGPGLTADAMAGLFGRFRHSTPGDGRRVDGVGLGLAFVHSVVKQHGGTVSCRSEPGLGATFEVVLPLLAASE